MGAPFLARFVREKWGFGQCSSWNSYEVKSPTSRKEREKWGTRLKDDPTKAITA